MFGDYEAQRHWQEITVNVPLKEWYFDTPNNNLTYWGLDYPPLTAYHSLIMGRASRMVEPESVTLESSRGYETPSHKVFMRFTVILSDLLVYLPGAVAFARSFGSDVKKCLSSLALLSLYPGLILIDAGHFQYNNVSLGLMMAACAALFRNWDALGSALFVCAINYKQMEMYHSLPFFFFLLGKCWMECAQKSFVSAAARLAKIGLAVIATFFLIWAPFIVKDVDNPALDLEQAKQILHRIFPVARGIFEDKVANFWCCLNVVFKLKAKHSIDQLFAASLAMTLVTSIPTNILLLLKPTKQNFLLALINTSLAFYLFSFQVHEKTILLCAIPVLLYVGASCQAVPSWVWTKRACFMCVWFLLISIFSMFPLLIRDKLSFPTVSLAICFLLLCNFLKLLDVTGGRPLSYEEDQPKRNVTPKPLTKEQLQGSQYSFLDWVIWTAFNLSLIGCLAIGYLSLFMEPPEHLPDIWPLLISVFSAGHFMFFMAYFNYLQWHYQAVSPKVHLVSEFRFGNISKEKKIR